jgi:hypothetical protein
MYDSNPVYKLDWKLIIMDVKSSNSSNPCVQVSLSLWAWDDSFFSLITLMVSSQVYFQV